MHAATGARLIPLRRAWTTRKPAQRKRHGFEPLQSLRHHVHGCKVVFRRVRTEPYPAKFLGYYPYRNYFKCCMTFISVLGTSVSSGTSVSYVRLPCPYSELLQVLEDFYTRTRNATLQNTTLDGCVTAATSSRYRFVVWTHALFTSGNTCLMVGPS